MGIDCKRFVVQPVNGDFICTICEDVFDDPVERGLCEHIYCRDCITRWLLYNPICPIDRERLTHGDLQEVPRVFKSLLGSLQVHCTYAEKGCSQITQLDLLSVHESECLHGPAPRIKCPNNCGFKSEGRTDSSHACIDVLKKTILEQRSTIRQQEAQIQLLKRENERQSRTPLMAILRSPIDVQPAQSENSANYLSHREGIETLWRKGVIKSRIVFDAMGAFNLIHFYGTNAFKDNWAFGHAKNLEAVVPHLTPTLTKVLVVNNFSGYFQACLSNILGPRCKIFTVVDTSTNGMQLLRTFYPHVLSTNRVVLLNSDQVANEATYSMIIEFSKEKVSSGRFDRLLPRDHLF